MLKLLPHVQEENDDGDGDHGLRNITETRVQGGTRTDQPWGSHTVGREGTAARRASIHRP